METFWFLFSCVLQQLKWFYLAERGSYRGEVLFAGSGREPLNCCNTIVAKMSIITAEMAEAEGREGEGTVGVANGASWMHRLHFRFSHSDFPIVLGTGCSTADRERVSKRESVTERELVNNWLWVFRSRTVGVACHGSKIKYNIRNATRLFPPSFLPSLLALALISPFLCTHFQFDACQLQIQIHFMSPSVSVYLWFNYCCKFVQQSHKSRGDTHTTNFLMWKISFIRAD